VTSVGYFLIKTHHITYKASYIHPFIGDINLDTEVSSKGT
jgi:hypothetical protein